MPIEEKIHAWIDADPPPAETIFSIRRAAKLMLSFFALAAIGTLPGIILQSMFPPAPQQKPIEAELTLEDLDEADKKGQLGSGFKRILEMRKQQQTK